MTKTEIFVAFLCAVVALTIIVSIYKFATRPPATCVTHVPDTSFAADRQCSYGAHVEAVNGAALCICPKAKP